MVFHWSLSDTKSPQVSRTLLSILAVLNNDVVWMLSTRPPTSRSSRPFNNSLITVPKAPITTGIIVTFMFHRFFSILWQGRGTYPLFHTLSVLFYGQLGQQSRQFCKFTFFCCWLLLGLVFWPRLGDLCVCQSPIVLYVCDFLEQVVDFALLLLLLLLLVVVVVVEVTKHKFLSLLLLVVVIRKHKY